LRTTSRISLAGMTFLLWAGASDGFGADRLVACAALGKQKPDKVLKCFGIRGMAKERALASNRHKAFVLQLVEMMRKRGRRDAQLRADLADDEALRVGREQKPDDAQPGLSPKGGKHVGVTGSFLGVAFAHDFLFHVSIYAEIWNVKVAGPF
jgi:hypothetical protein